jgi:hypothetical protein
MGELQLVEAKNVFKKRCVKCEVCSFSSHDLAAAEFS